MLLSINKFLAARGLRFPESGDEHRFFRETFIANKLTVQIWLAVGGLVWYIFFIWDQIIDPSSFQTTHIIRGLIGTPVVWLCGALLSFRRLEYYYELIAVTPVMVGCILLGIIYSILRAGFDYGAVGPVLVILFGIAALPVRIVAFVGSCVVAWVGFDTFQLVSDNAKPGMFLVNNLSIGTAVFLGVFSVVLREYAARQQFMAKRDLSVADARVNEFLQSLTPSEILVGHKTHILISYRRTDTEAIAGRIRDRLVKQFGEQSVFMDIDSIPYGVDFRDYIQAEMKKADFLISVIGPDWLGTKPGMPARIDDQLDPVRVEIETAQENGIPIVPVLVGGAVIPEPASLPETLQKLSFLNAASVDSGRDFHQHMDRLIRSLIKIIEQRMLAIQEAEPARARAR